VKRNRKHLQAGLKLGNRKKKKQSKNKKANKEQVLSLKRDDSHRLIVI